MLHGWENVNDKNVPIKCLKPAAPEAMLALVKCGCKLGCGKERHCVCLRNKLACTNACACSDCENEFVENDVNCEELSVDEDNEDTD